MQKNALPRDITIIAAVAENNAIGRNGKLIYRLPNDMRRFRALTTGHTVIMGRRTFESLPKGALPDRRNIVLSRTATCPGCEVFSSLEEALRHCAENEKIFIIGGAEVYRAALPLAAKMSLTLVHDTPEADTFFPDFSDDWEETSREDFPADDKHAKPYSFVEFIRKKG